MRRWLSAWFYRSSPSLSERRWQERRSLHLEVRCRRAGTQLQGTLLDVSAEGLCVQLSTRLAAGERLEVAAPHGPALLAGRSVTCQVVWCERRDGAFLVGLRCSSGLYGSWLSELVTVQRTFRRREHRRFPARAAAQIALEDGLVALGELVDVSLGGAQLRVACRPLVGQLVRVRLNGLNLVASVVGCTLAWEADQAVVNLRFLKGQPALRGLRRIVAREAA